MRASFRSFDQAGGRTSFSTSTAPGSSTIRFRPNTAAGASFPELHDDNLITPAQFVDDLSLKNEPLDGDRKKLRDFYTRGDG